MKVKTLIEELSKMDQNAEVVINGTVIQGVTTVKGRLKDGYFGKQFVRLPNPNKGKDEVVTFTFLIERSDGEIDYSSYWT